MKHREGEATSKSKEKKNSWMKKECRYDNDEEWTFFTI